MTVRNLLKTKGRYVTTAPADMPIRDVVQNLVGDDVGALVVTEDGKRIDGIISERDIVRGMKEHGDDVFDMPVSRLMRTDVTTCDIDAPMIGAMHLMNEHQIRHVPVLENGQLCGIVSIHDIIENRMTELQREAEALRSYIAGY